MDCHVSLFFYPISCLIITIYFFIGLGAGYATAKTGVAVVNICVMRPELLMKAILPVVMAGIVGLYGIIVTMVLSGSFIRNSYPLFLGAMHFGGGLACGLSSLAAGFAIGVVGEAGVRGFAQQPRLFMGMILILIFAEVLGLYGAIGAIMLNMRGTADVKCGA